ncbi:MAG TPA: hypothetical protein VKU03_13585, partial [Roseiarcus sp.]|nr:hypothetical protein [Roseiarcus sp.]
MSMNRVAAGGDIAIQEGFEISSSNFCCRDSEKAGGPQGVFETTQVAMTQIPNAALPSTRRRVKVKPLRGRS